jgi:hypothetical protein
VYKVPKLITSSVEYEPLNGKFTPTSQKKRRKANWVCRSFESFYAPYLQHYGAYYELINGRLLYNHLYANS